MTVSIRANDAFEYSLLSQWATTAAIGLCVLDEDNVVTVLNRPACNFISVDPATVLNRPVRVLLRSASNGAEAETWIDDEAADIDFLLQLGSENSNRYLQLKKSRVRDPQRGSFQIISLSDVTALQDANRKLAQQAAMETQRRHWQALNAGVVVVDAVQADMPIIYANAAFEKMSGYSAHEIIGKNCRFMQRDDVLQPGLPIIRDAIKNEKSGYAVLRNYKKDGTRFVNELFVSPIYDSTGKLIQFVGVQHLRTDQFL